MAFSDFPFAEILTHGDLYVVYRDENNETVIIPAIDLLQWYEHSCDCSSCKRARTIMDKHLIHGTKRVSLFDTTDNIVYFDMIPDEFDLAKLATISMVYRQSPIRTYEERANNDNTKRQNTKSSRWSSRSATKRKRKR